jgi:hypothetical protein
MLICTSLPSYGSSIVLSSLPYSRFTSTPLSSPLLLLLRSMPMPKPTRLVADVAYGVEANGLASRLCSRCAIVRERGKGSGRQRMVRWRWGMSNISFCPRLAWICTAGRWWPQNRSPDPRSRLPAGTPRRNTPRRRVPCRWASICPSSK